MKPLQPLNRLIRSLALAGGLIFTTVTAQAAEAETLPASYYADLARVQVSYGKNREAAASFAQALLLESEPERRAGHIEGMAEALEAAGDATASNNLWHDLATNEDPVRAANATLHLAAVAAAAGDNDGALKLLEPLARSCEIEVYRKSAGKRLATVLGDKLGVVLARYEAEFADHPDDRGLLDLIVLLDKDLGRRADALAKACAAAPTDIELLRRYSDALMSAQRWNDAQVVFIRMRRDYSPLAMECDQQLARIAHERGDEDAANAAVMRSASKMVDDVRRSLYLSREFGAINHWREAERHARLARERAADQGAAMIAATDIELGEALMHQGKRDQATPILEPLARQDIWPGLKLRADALLTNTNTNEPFTNANP